MSKRRKRKQKRSGVPVRKKLTTRKRWLYGALIIGFFVLTTTPYLIDLVLRPDRWNMFIMAVCATVVTILTVSLLKQM